MKKRSIIKILFLYFGLMISISLLIVGTISIILRFKEYKKLTDDSINDFYNKQETFITIGTNKIIDFIEYKKSLAENQLKNSIKEMGYVGHNIATNIYNENKNKKDINEIKKMIKDALRPIRSNNGRGYFFINRMDGLVVLYTEKPHLEGTNFWDTQDVEGKYIVRDMIDIALIDGEGFYHYEWHKPGNDREDFPKIAFIKYFEPFNWYIATGEYLDDVKSDIKEETINRINQMAIKDNSYVIIHNNEGDIIINSDNMGVLRNQIKSRINKIVKRFTSMEKQSQILTNFEVEYENELVDNRKNKVGNRYLAFTKKVNEWNWTISMVTNIDEIDDIIKTGRIEILGKFIQYIVIIASVIILSMIAITLLFKYLTIRIGKNLKVFYSFFDLTTKDYKPIDIDTLNYYEFDRLAKAANKMITERKIMEQDLEKSNALLRESVEQSPAGILIADAPDVRIISVNSAALNIRGRTNKQLTDISVESHSLNWQTYNLDGTIYDPEDLPLSKAILKGVITRNEEVIIRDEDNHDHFVLVNASPVRDRDSKIIAGIVIFTDITEMKRMQRNYQLISNYTQDLICLHEPNGTYSYLSPSVYNILGYDAEELIGLSPYDLIHEDDQKKIFENSHKKVLQGETTYSIDYRIRRKNGEYVWFESSSTPILNSNNEIIKLLTISRNISNRKLAEKQIKQLNEELEQKVIDRTKKLEETNEELKNSNVELETTNYELYQTNLILEKTLWELNNTQQQLIQTEKMAVIGDLVAGVAHEINTPLGICLSLTSHLKLITDKKNQLFRTNKLEKSDYRDFLEISKDNTELILANLKKSIELINNFKQLAIDQTVEDWGTVKLKQYVDDIITTLKPKYKNTNHKIKLYCDNKLEVYTYPGAISQILTNLINNSLIHGFRGINNGEISIKIAEENNNLIIQYSDNGIGMNKELLSKIFEPFFTTRKNKGGTGLGMNIIYNLVTYKLKGNIEYQSEVNKGFHVKITIPISYDKGE